MKEEAEYFGIYLGSGESDVGRDIYRRRRERLSRQFKHPILISSPTTGPGGNEIWPYIEARIWQEPLLIYLTGVNQYPICLLLDADAEKNQSKEILFLPPRDSKFEFWQGRRLGAGDAEAQAAVIRITGIEQAAAMNDLNKIVKTRIQRTRGKIGLLWHENKKGRKIEDSNELFKKRLIQEHLVKKKLIVNISSKALHQRLCLEERDVQLALKANKNTALAFRELLSSAAVMNYEYEVSGFIDGAIRKSTPWGNAFPTIAAAGENAATLHYEKCGSSFSKNDLFLLDFGAREKSMHADISRTFPVSGKFDLMQKILYTIVLDTQKKVESEAKAGIRIKDLNRICWDYLNTALKKRFTDKGGKFSLLYENAPHGVSHLMGEMEHDGDVFGEYKNEKMREGWMISNEPGLYGEFSIEIGGKLYWQKLGIRIEDNLIIRNGKPLNLSMSCPKEITAIEHLMNVQRR